MGQECRCTDNSFDAEIDSTRDRHWRACDPNDSASAGVRRYSSVSTKLGESTAVQTCRRQIGAKPAQSWWPRIDRPGGRVVDNDRKLCHCGRVGNPRARVVTPPDSKTSHTYTRHTCDAAVDKRPQLVVKRAIDVSRHIPGMCG